jgi:hypothetical protein
MAVLKLLNVHSIKTHFALYCNSLWLQMLIISVSKGELAEATRPEKL